MALESSHASAVNAAEEGIRRGTNVTFPHTLAKDSGDSLPTLPSIHSIINGDQDTQVFRLGYKRWTDHSFESEPPFVLSPTGSGSWCPRKAVTVHDPLFPAFDVGIFPLEMVRYTIQLRWLKGYPKNPAEQDFVWWFLRLQRHPPQDISLEDRLLYPTPGVSTAGFRRRVWALFTLMGSQIQLPDTGSVFLVLVKVSYQDYSITLWLGEASLRVTRTLLLPRALLSEDETFRKWLDTAQVPPLIQETKRTSSSMSNLGATATQQQGFLETPRVLTTTQAPRSFTVEQPQAVDVQHSNIVESTCVRAHGRRDNSSQKTISIAQKKSYDAMMRGVTCDPTVDELGFEKPFLRPIHVCPGFKVRDWAETPFVLVLRPGLLPLETACLRIRSQGNSTSQAQFFLCWFARVHRWQSLGNHITLIDQCVYPDTGKPGIESFRRKVWALLSMIGKRIIIPTVTVDCVRLFMIQPDYHNFKVSLHVEGPDGRRVYVPFPCDSRADNPDTWLETMDLNQYPERFAHRLTCEPKDLSREIQFDLQFYFYFANHVFEHAQVHKILQSRYPGHFSLTAIDIQILYCQLLIEATDEKRNEWREWAPDLGSDEKSKRIVALIADWRWSSKKRCLSEIDPPLGAPQGPGNG